jgi:hypothetical protein
MPRVKRLKKNRRASYEKGHAEQLLEGMSIGASFGNMRRGRCDCKAMRAAWDDLRNDLLPPWITDHPFERPVAFWLFDAKEPRLRTAGEQRIESMELVKKRGLYGGSLRLCFFEELNIRLGAEETRGNEGEWETERQYLCRIGALTDSELALL